MEVFADVSSFNDVTSWKEYGAHHDIIGIKLTEGKDFEDPLGVRRGHESRGHVTSRLFYHFARFGQYGRRTNSEADFYVHTLHKAGGLGPHDAVILDLEWAARIYPAVVLVAKYHKWFQRVRKQLNIDHRRTGCYTGGWFWTPRMGAPRVKEWGWPSAYVPFDQFNRYAPRSFRDSSLAHQFSDGKFGPEPHHCAGIAGGVDMNRLLVHDADALFRAMGVGKRKPKPKPPKPPTPGGPVPSPKYPGHIIKRGDKGTNVKLIQRRLRIADDGRFGRQTLAAVKNFQRHHQLEAKGKVGPLTWAALFN